MENASKALIMAASVLLGVMIVSVGVALFNSFSSFGAETVKKMEEKQISEWNNNYLKYYGNTEYLKDEDDQNSEKSEGPIKVTAHDIISVINSASQNNINYFGEDKDEWPSGYNNNYYYIQIDVDSSRNAEKWDEAKKMDFLKNNSFSTSNPTETKYYKVASEPQISSVTKRVMYMKFVEYK